MVRTAIQNKRRNRRRNKRKLFGTERKGIFSLKFHELKLQNPAHTVLKYPRKKGEYLQNKQKNCARWGR